MGNNNNNNLSFFFLLIMMVALFFFLKPGKNNKAASQQNTEQTAAAAQSTAASPLSPSSALSLASIAKTHGQEVEGRPGAYRLQNGTLDVIGVPSDSINPISGTIKVDNDLLDVKDIIAGQLDSVSPERAAQASLALAKAINTYDRYKSFAPFFFGSNETLQLSNDLVTVDFSTKGGKVSKVTLNKYKTETTDPATDVVLFDATTGSYQFTFATSDQRICTDSLFFRPVAQTDSSLVMSLPLGHGAEWQIRYTLVPGEYIVRMDIEQKGISAIIPPSTTTMDFSWWQRMGRNEKGRTFEERQSGIYYKYLGEGPKELNNNKKKTEDLNSRVKWVAFKNQFFSSVIIPRASFSSAKVSSTPLKNNPKFVKYLSMSATVPYNQTDGTAVSFDFFFGPNSYPMLSKLDDKLQTDGENLDLNRLVPLGWTLFRWINQLIVIPVFTFLSKFTHNYGIIILLLTVFIKIILFPFTYKSYISQAKMRALAPEIKEINDKYPGDENAMKRQQETMALYSRAGASPFSGCLPMLLQMPILIAMFAFFPSAIELRGQSFLWAHDLSAPDSICTLPFSIPWYGNHVSLFCLLMTVTNVIYIHLNMQTQAAGPNMGAMKWMQYLMPVMFLFFFNDYASGLSYYYFLSLLITILQTWIFRKCINDDKLRQEMKENAKNPKEKQGCMGMLGDMQKRQEAMLREQQRQNGRKRK